METFNNFTYVNSLRLKISRICIKSNSLSLDMSPLYKKQKQSPRGVLLKICS